MSANTILTSVVTGGSNNHATVAEEANALATDFVSAGVVGTISLNAGSGGTGSFAVNADASPDMGVTIKAGQAYITATPSSQGSQVLRARAAADYTTYVINSNSSGSTKYDWIYLSVSATNANTPSATADNVASLVTSRSSSNSADNGTPPTYGILLAVVTVANAASSITNSNISDRRTQASVSTSGTPTATGWVSGLTVPTTVTYNGNRSYSLVFNSVDITGTVSNGMRLRSTRLVAAPTQCTSLNGTTQYYSKSSPAGMTFTDDFVVSAWIKLTSYPTTRAVIASRFNGTSGWRFSVQASGVVELVGYNASSSNFSLVDSYQAIPLNKWVHVTAQLDMSSFSASPTTSYVMIDGVDVPATVSRAGTNPTALIQAGNLEIGSENSGTFFLSGKLAQVAVFNAKVTEATMQGYISQGLAGTETSLISAYSFNNSITDLNANANNLTANGSAVATNADSPFAQDDTGTPSGTVDFGIITSKVFSSNTTLTVQVPTGCTIPTSGGVSALSYSMVRTPYGFPAASNSWRLEWFPGASVGGSASANTWVNPNGAQLSVPIGSWILGYEGMVSVGTSSSVTDVYTTISTANNTESDITFTTRFTLNLASGTTAQLWSANRRRPLNLTSQAIYYANLKSTTANTALQIRGESTVGEKFIIEAEFVYL